MNKKVKFFLGVVAPQFISYFVFLVFVPVALLTTLIHAAITARKSLKAAAFVILLSPIPVVSTISFASGIVGYLTNEGRLIRVGLPGLEFRNLDARYRCYWETPGCCVMGWEIFTHEPHNFALKEMITLFGPMRGYYLGPYPGRDQVFDLLKKTPKVISLTEATNAIPMSTNSYLFGSISALFSDKECAPVKLAEYESQVLIIGNRRYASLFSKADGKKLRYISTGIGRTSKSKKCLVASDDHLEDMVKMVARAGVVPSL